MHSAATIRKQVELALAARVPAALTPQPRMVRPQVPTGIDAMDELLGGGLPLGAVTELTGAECTGRTSIALSLIARLTREGKVCAWVDASNALDPESAASAGVDLRRLLWVRCGSDGGPANSTQSAPSAKRAAAPEKLRTGSCGSHPREEGRGLSEAVASLFGAGAPERTGLQPREVPSPSTSSQRPEMAGAWQRQPRPKQYDCLERALRSTDLLLGTGGFGAIILDLASIKAEHVARIELSTWHRYRVAAEKAQTCFLLLTQHPCAKSGSELQLQLLPAKGLCLDTVFCGLELHLQVQRQRFNDRNNRVVPMRKPVANAHSAAWQTSTCWAGTR